MADNRFAVRRHGNGNWYIEDRDFVSLPTSAAWNMSRMGVEEAERVVQLMNELDRRLRARNALNGGGESLQVGR